MHVSPASSALAPIGDYCYPPSLWYWTNSRLATAYIRAFCAVGQDEIGIKSWDEY